MADDKDDDLPPIRLVSDNPTARADRKIGWAKDEVERALSGFAAALLRVIAGSKSESIYLVHRLIDVVKALNKFSELAKRGLASHELEEMLRLPTADYASREEDWRHRRWLRDHGFEIIMTGALRLAAHKLLGQDPQFGGKYSTEVIERGIEILQELNKPIPPMMATTKKSKGLAASWDDLESPMKPNKAATVETTSRRNAGFGHADLKELRKAIKANDKKRIAELTAKINPPKLDKD